MVIIIIIIITVECTLLLLWFPVMGLYLVIAIVHYVYCIYVMLSCTCTDFVGKGLTQGYQPNKNDKVSVNMEGLMEFQENRIQDIQGQSSADVLEQQNIKEHTKALDSDVNGNATQSPTSSPSKQAEEINKNESSEGILHY